LSNPLTTTYQRITLVLLVPAVLYFVGCSPLKKNLKHLDQNQTFAHSFNGFVLFEPENNQKLFDHQGSKYFTPASNTKLFTFYLANKILGDSIPAFEYRIQGDSIWLRGTGDPSFLNPDLPASGTYNFLKDRNIFLVRDRFREPEYGPGWAWDDYSGGYQRRKAAFPIYGNALHLSWDSIQDQPVIIPPVFVDSVSFNKEETERALLGNRFSVSHKWEKKDTLNIPFYATENLYQILWSDTLGTTVNWVDTVMSGDQRIFYSVPADSVYKRVLQDSDNFLAEQLILICSWKLFGELNSGKTIDLLSDSLLTDLPDKPIWVDGSGLSRYNLFTPRSLVSLLNKIYREVGLERIYKLFPAGGESGTIKEYYTSDPPYIFAKTGTLRNNHALSGYLVTRKGKVLIFSFMHNHYAGGSDPIKKEMEKLLWQVHLKY
jgi:D-alanyl-D-alanine carboxypeptidase/D-alanyl-D-alanine-endopeptidase (penicillin-binding protein 4)